jgi:hypothetical protein
VVEHGYTECDHGDGQQLFLDQMRAYWVPWSLANKGLLAGILMTASRSLQSLYPDNALYSTSLLVYKNECISLARKAISRKTESISDYDIALALVLGAEEVTIPSLVQCQTIPVPNRASSSWLVISKGSTYIAKPLLRWPS